MHKVVIAGHDEQGGIGQQFILDPAPVGAGCIRRQGEETRHASESPAQGRLRVRVEPRATGAFLQEGEGLFIERGFLGGEVFGEIYLPGFHRRAVDDGESPSQDVRIGSAAGIGRGGEFLCLSRGENRRRPRGLAEEGEAGVSGERNGGGSGQRAEMISVGLSF